MALSAKDVNQVFEAEELACIVVHHRNVPGIQLTVGDAIREGVAPTQLVVIDNSESTEVEDQLREAFPAHVVVASIPNGGYANAVNAGLELVKRRSHQPKYLLVLTHDVRLSRGSVARLVQDLAEHPRIGVVGPELWEEGGVWSSGGEISGALRVPRHVREPKPEELRNVSWLDGAVNLYRWQALQGRRLCEDYFMYFEEVDFHLSLARDGWDIAIDSSVRAVQHSSGIPAGLHGRNLTIFVGRNYSRLVALFSALICSVRGAAWSYRHRPGKPFLRPYFRGVVEGFHVLARMTDAHAVQPSRSGPE